MKKFVSLISGILLTITYSFSQTNVPGGYVSGTWTAASSPYIIDGEITLDTTDLLIIEPGVDVEFSGHYKFIIHGRLLAEGTETDSIHFTAQDTTVGWHGLRFGNTDLNGQDSSKLSYCLLDYGKAYGTTFIDSTGGAIRCDTSSSLLINNSTINRNSALKIGGAIRLNKSNIVIKNTIIENNQILGSGSGGGIATFGCNSLKLQNVIIAHNQVSGENGRGGGIFLRSPESSFIELINVEIRNNYVTSKGGGIFCDNYVANLNVNNCRIYNNEASEYGGAIYGDFNTVSSVDFDIYNNMAHRGGGIFLPSCDGNIANINLYGNEAEYGGSIYLWLTDNIIFSQLMIYGNSASRGAGIVIDSSENIEFKNVTVADNVASDEGGSLRIVNHSSALFDGCIFYDNIPDEISNDGTSIATFQYSLVSGGYPGIENIDEDPLFADPAITDYGLSWDHFPEADTTKSPCIDTGDPFIIDPDGTRSDMGAIPFEQTFSPIPSGDINGTLSCAGSPYYVFGDISVPLGEELVIEPCVYVVFQGDFSLTVYGRLIAEGTVTDRITFYPADTITGWQGIRFYDQNTNGQDSSKLVHCRVMYGNADVLYSHDANGGGAYFNNSSDVLINNCLFLKNRAITSGGAIYLTQSSPDIRNSIFENNSALNGGAVCCYDNVNTTFLNCNFSNNLAEDGGSFVVSSCAPGFNGCSMTNNRATRFGGALYHDASGAPTFDNLNRCNIYDNYADYAGLDFYTTAGYTTPPVLDIYLDTASVALMNEHFAYPFQYFNIISNNARFAQEDSDLYVSTSGSDLNSGTSASDPLATIKMALIKIITNSDDPKTIHIANGIYSVSETGETLPINHRSHTTLSGEFHTTTNIDGDSLHRIMISYTDVNDSVINLRFQNGYVDGDGGAVVIENYSNPSFYLCGMVNNYCTGNGGAIRCENHCSPVFNLSYIMNNYADNSGGGLFMQSNDSIVMNYVIIGSNTSRYSGGGLYSQYHDCFRINTSIIAYNNLLNGGGGGAFFRQGDVQINNTGFVDNHVIGSGGGLHTSYNVDLELNNSTFTNNRASGTGGGMYFYLGVDANLENMEFFGNSSVHGGAIYGHVGSSLEIRNGLFSGNNTLYDTLVYGKGNGGAMSLSFVETNLYNVTLANNESSMIGGGLYFYSDASTVHNVQNSIIYNNTPNAISTEYDASVYVNYCDIEGDWPTGIGNFSMNPYFSGVYPHHYSLDDLSPCIDMGNPDTTGLFLPDYDLAGNPRIGNDRIDMGGYEYYDRRQLDLKVFLEGPYNGLDMDTTLLQSELIPLDHPFNVPPWNCYDILSISSVPDSIVDWVLLELRHSPSYIFITKVPLFIKYNGNIVDPLGGPVSFQTNIPDIRAVIHHRNHLSIMSADPLLITGDVYSYDFTTGAGQAYGTDAQKDLGEGVFGMYAGDADANGIIELDDKTLFWSLEAGSSGYLNSDFNLDSQTDNKDKNDLWIYNLGETSQIPD